MHESLFRRGAITTVVAALVLTSSLTSAQPPDAPPTTDEPAPLAPPGPNDTRLDEEPIPEQPDPTIPERPTGTPDQDDPETPTATPAPEVTSPLPSTPDLPEEAAREELPTGNALRVQLNGFYRARLSHIGNVPTGIAGGVQDSANATFAFQRLRLRPSITYGPNPDAPLAAVRMEADVFDNVVFGDNARLARAPLFAERPSLTDYEGFELRDSFRVQRAWLEFMIGIGQVRVGRMPLEWGLGILTQNDNRLDDWGDPQFGSAVDRILFITRPITLYNTIARGDSRTTPLAFGFAFDKLSKDPITDTVAPPPEGVAARDHRPFGFLTGRDNDVNQINVAFLWDDPDFGPGARDRLTFGYFMLYRWQNVSNSTVLVHDVTWRYRSEIVPNSLSFFTEGEGFLIHGESGALPFRDLGCVAWPCPTLDVQIWGAVGRVGVVEPTDFWKAWLEVGYSSGDDAYLLDDRFTVRPFHPDYRVGLLTYQVALASRTAQAFALLDQPGDAPGQETTRALWSRGGVWNSKYLWPQVRYTLFPGLEAHGAVLLSWADRRPQIPTIYTGGPGGTNCGFGGDCLIGVEVNAALRARWGENDLMWADLETGFMRAGNALSDGPLVLADEWLWTVQTRVAMRF